MSAAVKVGLLTPSWRNSTSCRTGNYPEIPFPYTIFEAKSEVKMGVGKEIP
jgi:hypothetical protein